ncbi:hypothetical protein B7463_g9387, partial [Scytalidium lignicola]
MLSKVFILSLFSGLAASQRPSNISICDWYAEKLFGANSAANQQLVMTHITNTAIIGNYTTPNVGISVRGIAPITNYNGTDVNLLNYFDAALDSTNDGVTPHGVAKLFLDDGGATPLAMSLASIGNTSSAQFNLVTHVWQYFGVLLNCSLQGTDGFPSYKGRQSMYEVHKFMDSTEFEQGWFVYELAQAAKSIGFSDEDTTIWYNTMTGLFSYRCAPPVAIGNQPPQLQSICVAPSCPLAENADCSLYGEAVPPTVANATLAGNYTKGTNMTRSTGTPTASPTPSMFPGVGSVNVARIWEVVAGLALAFAI